MLSIRYRKNNLHAHTLCERRGAPRSKYQIIDIETTTSLVKGGVDRIGDSPSAFTHAVPGRPTVEGEIDAPTHTDAIAHSNSPNH